jgi:hypothetical protein
MHTPAARKPFVEAAKKVFFAPVIAGFLVGSLPILLPALIYRAAAGTRS